MDGTWVRFPDLGRFHVLQSNSDNVPQLLKPTRPEFHALQQEKPLYRVAYAPQLVRSPTHHSQRKLICSEDTAQAKKQINNILQKETFSPVNTSTVGSPTMQYPFEYVEPSVKYFIYTQFGLAGIHAVVGLKESQVCSALFFLFWKML